MAVRQFLISVILSALISATACASKVENHDSALHERDVDVSQASHETAHAENDKFSIPDSINFDGILNFDCMGEGWGIKNCQIIFNNDSSLLKVKVRDYNRGKEFLQFRLKKPVADCFKRLLYEIYSNYTSAIKDDIPKKRIMVFVVQSNISIKINLDGKEIKDSFSIVNLRGTYDEYGIDPFRPQFIKIEDLLYAILENIDKEYYRPNRKITTPDWIVEEFNYDYYEPYNEEEEK